MKRSLLLAVLTAGALLAPASAGASQLVRDYAVTIEGEASYNRADVYGDAAAQHDHAFVFRTTIPKLRLVGGRLEAPVAGAGSATVTRSHFAVTGSEGDRLECQGGRTEDVRGGLVAPDGDGLRVRMLDAVSVVGTSCDEPMQTGALRLLRGEAGMVEDRMVVTPAEMSEKAIIRTFTGEVTGDRCPLRIPETELCSLSWSATVTFVLDESELFVPLVPPPPPPAPDPLDELFVPLTAQAKVTATRAVLPLQCAAACSGTVRARGGSRARFAAAAGQTARVRVRLRRPARRVRLAVTVRSAGQTQRSVIRLRRR